MGKRGRRELEEHHSCEQYAAAIVEMARRAADFRARAASLKLAERAGILLSEWVGPSAMAQSGANVAREILEFAEE